MPEKFTLKSQEAINDAMQLAKQQAHQQVDCPHLALALLRQQGGVVPLVLEKMVMPPSSLARKIEEELVGRYQVQGGKKDVYFSSELASVVEKAGEHMRFFKDEYISVEHLFLALFDEYRFLKEFFRISGIDRDRLLEGIKDIRGSHRITDENPEDKLQPLEKYGRDLTDLALRGKLDPVIGRDDEMRRFVQVLSRRTKNNPVLIGDPGVGKTAVVEGLAQRIAPRGCAGGLKEKEAHRLGHCVPRCRQQVPRRV